MNRITDDCVAMVKEFEGFSGRPYTCPAGKQTIGYGHVIKDGDTLDYLTKEQADALLRKDLESFGKFVRAYIAVPLNDNEYSALCSLCFNVGTTPIAKGTLGKLLNSGDRLGAAQEFPRWVYAGGKALPGLVRHREAEMNLFMEPV